MNDDQLDDLKQFIDTRISQSESRLEDKIEHEIGTLRQEMQDGFSGVAEAIEDLHKRDDEFDVRVTKLKQKAA